MPHSRTFEPPTVIHGLFALGGSIARSWASETAEQDQQRCISLAKASSVQKAPGAIGLDEERKGLIVVGIMNVATEEKRLTKMRLSAASRLRWSI